MQRRRAIPSMAVNGKDVQTFQYKPLSADTRTHNTLSKAPLSFHFAKSPNVAENHQLVAAVALWLLSHPEFHIFYQETVCGFHGDMVVLPTATSAETPYGKEISQISVSVFSFTQTLY